MSNEFDFKEVDLEGLEILDAISGANNFNRWMFDKVVSECSGKILEIGSGLGNISRFFVENNSDIHLTDVRNNYVEFLREKFPISSQNIFNLDIVHPEFDSKYADLIGQFDSCFCLNVVEHIKDDSMAVSNILKVLKPNGKAVILVPAFNFVYNSIDKSLEHYRRYTVKTLSSLVPPNVSIEKSYYFNAMGIPAWFIGGKLLKQDSIPKGEMGLYDFFVPVWKGIDRLVQNSFGLSVVLVLRKNP